MAANMSNEGGIGNVRFLKNCMGTWLVQELRRAWRARDGREMEWEELNALTEQGRRSPPSSIPTTAASTTRRTWSRPSWSSAGAPAQEPPSDRGTMLRCVYESLALKYRVVSEQIAPASGSPNKVIHIVGGGSRNTFLNQLTANACGMKVDGGTRGGHRRGQRHGAGHGARRHQEAARARRP